MKSKILVFSGAGIDQESGIPTFRTGSDGLWYNHKIEDVATIGGWRRDKSKVLDFYNQRRSQLKDVSPNDAHRILFELENIYDITIVTQNVSNLHELAGSTKVIHLHGELTKVRSTLDRTLVYDWDGDCNIGDKCERGSQLRPDIVWFGEELDDNNLNSAISYAKEADICIIVGTSMNVSPANSIPFLTNDDVKIYYIDPSEYVNDTDREVIHIKDVATNGMRLLEYILNLKN